MNDILTDIPSGISSLREPASTVTPHGQGPHPSLPRGSPGEASAACRLGLTGKRHARGRVSTKLCWRIQDGSATRQVKGLTFAACGHANPVGRTLDMRGPRGPLASCRWAIRSQQAGGTGRFRGCLGCVVGGFTATFPVEPDTVSLATVESQHVGRRRACSRQPQPRPEGLRPPEGTPQLLPAGQHHRPGYLVRRAPIATPSATQLISTAHLYWPALATFPSLHRPATRGLFF